MKDGEGLKGCLAFSLKLHSSAATGLLGIIIMSLIAGAVITRIKFAVKSVITEPATTATTTIAAAVAAASGELVLVGWLGEIYDDCD